jgi:hypothetical protein
VHKQFSPAALITRVGNHVREICNVNYGSSPEFIFNGDVNTKFPYIPNHVEVGNLVNISSTLFLKL